MFRSSVLNPQQWEQAKKIFRLWVPKFFPDDRFSPVFVSMNADVHARLGDMLEEVKEAQERDQVANAPAPPPPPAAAAPARAAAPPVPAASASAGAPAFLSGLDMDVGVDVKTEAKAEEKRGIEQEIEDWLSPAAEALAWKLNPPEKSWPSLEMKVPRIALLAKRFLSIMTTSAPSERVWSGFGNLISAKSSQLDSERAAMVMFLRHNRQLAKQVPDSALS